MLKASHTWIASFKRKYGIVSRKITELVTPRAQNEKASIEDDVANFINTVKPKIQYYTPEKV